MTALLIIVSQTKKIVPIHKKNKSTDKEIQFMCDMCKSKSKFVHVKLIYFLHI